MFEIKDINYNSIINTKPNVELWISSLKDLSELDYTLLSKIIILIVVILINNYDIYYYL